MLTSTPEYIAAQSPATDVSRYTHPRERDGYNNDDNIPIRTM